MPHFRLPAVLMRDHNGGFTSLLLDPGVSDAVGFGVTRAAALADLRDRLAAEFREHEPSVVALGEARLAHYRVAVRTEYKVGKRVFPSPDALAVRVDVALAELGDGRIVGLIPVLGESFSCYPGDPIRPAVESAARRRLDGLAPAAAARLLAPPAVELDKVTVTVKTSGRDRRWDVTPRLRQVAEPLGDPELGRRFGRAWQREAAAADLAERLGKRRESVLLVGEPGVGKTTLLADAARRAEAAGEEPGQRRFWLTSGGRLIAGMKYLGQWEERLEEIIAELGAVAGVLCAERLLDLVQAGGRDETDSIAAFLLPFLARGEVRMAAEATPAELDACRRLMPGLADVFQIVEVAALNAADALAVITRALTPPPGSPVKAEPEAADRVYQLHRRFAPYAGFPGPTVRFARELLRDAGRRPDGSRTLTAGDAVDQFRKQTGLPERFLRDEWRFTRAEILEEFRQRVIDQPAACGAAADLVMTFKAGLNDPRRPLGVLLFCGPTGVGKTELARALARCFFGGDAAERADGRLIRLDMSEYAGWDAVARLIGGPDGEPGVLVRRVRRHPFSVVLLDEVEKASPDVFDALLGVFDEGRLGDRFGRVTHFQGCVIVMTSNLGAGRSTAFGFAGDRGASAYTDAAREAFRPEFFNRLDAVVPFDPLGPATIARIARKELAAVAGREGVRERRLDLRFSDALVAHLAEVGFHPLYGARPLQRAVERAVVAPLAAWVLRERPADGATLALEWEEGAITIHRLHR